MMNTLVPLWILGAPFVGLLILAFSFKGPSAMGGNVPRPLARSGAPMDSSAPFLDPVHPEAPRRHV
jgi:hypothetical protein